MNDIIFLAPVFKQMIWGGARLKTEFGYDIPGEDTGECWAVSAHPSGDCIIKNGQYTGKSLSWLWREHPEIFDYYPSNRFPLLVKIIDAKEDLSIQVHPDDVYAMQHEHGSYGKMECWYILDCNPNSTLVIGHRATTREEMIEMIKQERWNEFIQEIPVHKGDFIQINPGTVHAIKGGIMLLETQQNSDITYRVYDYHRLSNGKPRQLHVEQSIDVITVPAESIKESMKTAKPGLDNTWQKLIECKYYKVYRSMINGGCKFTHHEPFLISSVVQGEGTVNEIKIQKGDHFLISAYDKPITFHGEMELILSCPNNI